MKKTVVIFLTVLTLLMNVVPIHAQNLDQIIENYNRDIELWRGKEQTYQSQIDQLQKQLNDMQSPQKNPVAPKVKLTSIPSIDVDAGRTQTASFEFKNIGDSTARNLITQAYTAGEAPFTIEIVRGGGETLLNKDGKNVVDVKIATNADAKAGVYNITFKYTYKNIYDEYQEGTDTVSVKVNVPKELEVVKAGSVIVSDIKADRAVIYPGDVFNISAMLANLSNVEATDIQVSIEGLSSETVYLNASSEGLTYESRMLSGAKKDLSYELKVNEKLKAGSYPLTFKAKYKDKDKDNQQTPNTTEVVYYLRVQDNVSASAANRASLSIADLSSLLNAYNAGEEFSVDVVLKNNSNFAANNIKITATPPADVIVPTSANAMVIPTLGAWETMTVNFKFSPTEKALAQNYVINFKVEYDAYMEEGKAVRDSFEQYTGVNVVTTMKDTRKAQVVITDIVGPEQSYEAGYKPGEEFTVSMMVHNPSEVTAKNIRLSVTPPENVIVPKSSNVLSIPNLEPQESKQVEFRFTATDKALSQNYVISLKAEFDATTVDDKPVRESFEQFVGVNIASDTKDKNRAQVQFTQVTEPTGTYAPGEEFVVKVSVNNPSSIAAGNVRVTVTPPEGIIVPKSSNVHVIQSLAPNETRQAEFRFAATSKAATQSYVISLKAEYVAAIEDGKPITDSVEQYAGVNVDNPKAEEETPDGKKISKPKIIIDSYESDPILVKAGQQFDLKLSFQNTHSSKSINNIKATLKAVETTEQKGSVFTPVDGSNTIFIDSIDPKEKIDRQLRMFAVPDANPRSYTILVNFQYQDEDNNEYTEEEQIGINVKQNTNLETSDITFPTSGNVGMPVYLYFSLYNTGKVNLSNMKAEIKGNFDTANSTVFFGTLNKSNSAYYDGYFMPLEAGQQEGSLLITYEDDTGEKFEIKKEFTIDVMEDVPMDMDRMGMDMMMPMQPQLTTKEKLMAQLKSPWFWGGIVGFLSLIVALAVTMKRKNKKGLDFND